MPLSPVIPYPHDSKKVTALGFERTSISLPQKIMDVIKERNEKIKEESRKWKQQERTQAKINEQRLSPTASAREEREDSATVDLREPSSNQDQRS